MSNVDNFKQKLIQGGARPNLYNVIINFPGYAGGDNELTSFMCKGAQLPPSVIAQIDVPYRGRQLKVAGDRTFENWTATIFNDNDMVIRNSFERWMNGINNHEDNIGLVNPNDYQTDLIVQQLDRQDNVTKTYTITGAFPVNISGIDLAYETNDTIEEFTVEFAYQYWKSNTTS
jgi:hypothetical protein